MSSLAATQADGYYIPPENYSQLHKKSRNQLANQSSNKTNNTQTTVVRFELPYNGFCLHCGTMVGVGTRFNARKENTNDYYLSTRIIEFKMMCRHCAAMEFRIRTNPQQHGFDYVAGIHKKKEADVVDATSTATTTTTTTTPLDRLETMASDKRKAETERDVLQSLMRTSTALYQDDAVQNARLRKSFRFDRTETRARRAAASALGWGSDGMLLSETMSDIVEAKSTTFSNGKRTERKKFKALHRKSMFGRGGKKKKKLVQQEPLSSVSEGDASRNVVVKQEDSLSGTATETATPNMVVSSLNNETSSSSSTLPRKKLRLLVTAHGTASTIPVAAVAPLPHTLNDMLADYSGSSDEE